MKRHLAVIRERHRIRHRPSGYGFAFADRIGLFDARTWDALTAKASVFMQRPFLRAVEAAAPENLEPRYAILHRDGRPMAALVAQFIDVQGSRLARNGETAALCRLRAKLLVCGNVLSTGAHGLAAAEDGDAATLWQAVSEALLGLRRAKKLGGRTAFIMLKDFDGPDPDGVEALGTLGYGTLETEPNMVLELQPGWRSHADYVASLQTKYRKQVGGWLKSIEKAGMKVEKLEGLDGLGDELHRLYLAVHAGAALRLVTVTPDFLPALERELGGAFECTVIRRGEEIIGFVTNVRDGETDHGYLMGFDRAAHPDLPLYFRLLQAAIESAIRAGSRRLSLGRTALEPKARLGAKPVSMRVLMRHRVSPLNVLIRPLLRSIPHDEAPERHPFTG